MGWDDGDKGNPWQKQGNKGPADLDALVRDFQRKLSGFFGGGKGGGSAGGPNAINGGVVAGLVVAAIVIWAASGIYTVDEAERGVVLRFGEYRSTELPGLRWHWPWPLETVLLVNSNENVSYSYSGSMLTRDENIVNVDLIVQYRRTVPEDFTFSLRDPEATLQDVTASAIREIVGKNLLDFIITEGRAEIAAQTQDLLQSTLDDYQSGITIFEVNLQDANFPGEVESAVQDAIKAREDRERRILEAETYSNDLLPRARGRAAQQIEEAQAYRSRAIANAEGEASRFMQLLSEYQKAPEVTRERLYIETLEDILANSTKVLVDTEGGNNLLYLPLDQLTRRERDVSSSGSSQSSGSLGGSEATRSGDSPSLVPMQPSRTGR
jgi:membrane protease subunit HflK